MVDDSAVFSGEDDQNKFNFSKIVTFARKLLFNKILIFTIFKFFDNFEFYTCCCSVKNKHLRKEWKRVKY